MMNSLKIKQTARIFLMILPVAILMTVSAGAVPPHPLEYEKAIAAGQTVPVDKATIQNELERGINAPSILNDVAKASVSGTFRILTVLINFSDQASGVTPGFFDTLIYGNQFGTVHDYYDNVSYGQLDIVTLTLPSDIGWITAPQTYAYYVDGQRGFGSYPQNAQRLCEDIVNLIDPLVDFSLYDNDGNGFVDGLILVHTGTGYEMSYDLDDIHSHKWATTYYMNKDGVYVYEYNIQPEFWYNPGDMTCGVYVHELGHIFGLPDLYDTDYTSRGAGTWSIMASGSWLGPSMMGGIPAGPDAWSRAELGFKTPVNVTTNMTNVSIPNIENDGTIYRLWSSGSIGNEYFLVENRQNSGYDAYLPSNGLLIWHVDETKSSNDNEWYPGYTTFGNYHVALVQADGLFELEQNSSTGNGGDPFPGNSSNTDFTSISSPNSNSYAGDDTYVAVSNISASGSTMTADFMVSLLSDVADDQPDILPDKFTVRQNYPNPFNPSTNISFTLPSAGSVTVTIFNTLGQKVKILADGIYPAGETTLPWYSKDEYGKDVPSGIYFYEVESDYGTESQKMVLSR